MAHLGTGPFSVQSTPFPNVLFSQEFHTSLNGDAQLRYVDYDGANLVVDYIKAGTPGQVNVPWPADDNNPAINQAAANAVTAA